MLLRTTPPPCNAEPFPPPGTACRDKLAALMITYPSTHGVYEEGVDEICQAIHDNGGQVGRRQPGGRSRCLVRKG